MSLFMGAEHSAGDASDHAPRRQTHGFCTQPICETGDFLARGAELPQAVPGDLLCVYDTGAYGMSLASNYNTRPRAAEVLVEGKRIRLVRKRETLKELLQPELACL